MITTLPLLLPEDRQVVLLVVLVVGLLLLRAPRTITRTMLPLLRILRTTTTTISISIKLIIRTHTHQHLHLPTLAHTPLLRLLLPVAALPARTAVRIHLMLLIILTPTPTPNRTIRTRGTRRTRRDTRRSTLPEVGEGLGRRSLHYGRRRAGDIHPDLLDLALPQPVLARGRAGVVLQLVRCGMAGVGNTVSRGVTWSLIKDRMRRSIITTINTCIIMTLILSIRRMAEVGERATLLLHRYSSSITPTTHRNTNKLLTILIAPQWLLLPQRSTQAHRPAPPPLAQA